MKTVTSPIQIYQKGKEDTFGCLFCNPNEGMAIYESENFRVLVDTFPIVPGHIMISSRAHYGAGGELPEELQEEVVLLKDYLRARLKSQNLPCTFYEHGRAGCCVPTDPNGQKCEHFHLHCLPVNVSIRNPLEKRFSCLTLNHYLELMPLFQIHGNYLYVEEDSGLMMLFPVEDHFVDSHLLRTLVCNALGLSHRANWQEYQEPTVFLKGYEFAERLLQETLLHNSPQRH